MAPVRSRNKIVLLLLIAVLVIAPSSRAGFFDDFFSDEPLVAEAGLAQATQDAVVPLIEESFQSNPEQAWAVVEEVPQLLEKPAITKAAFDNSPLKSAAAFNKKPDVLKQEHVLARLDEEVQKTDATGKKNLDLLNDNDGTRKIFFQERFDLGMERVGKAPAVVDYDGISIAMGTTADSEQSTRFNINDFKGGKIYEDELVSEFGLEYEGNLFQHTKGLSKTIDPAGVSVYTLEGGKMDARNSVNALKVNSLQVGMVISGYTQYSGSFSFERGEESETIEGTFNYEGIEKAPSGHDTSLLELSIDGKIIKPKASHYGEFIIAGNTEVSEKNRASVAVKTDTQVYYTRKDSREAAVFCKEGFSCITDTPFDRLAFLNVQNNDRVSAVSSAYLTHLEVFNQQNGEVKFSSRKGDKGKLQSTIVFDNTNKVKYDKNLANAEVGRIDVISQKDPSCSGDSCTRILQHWSSNKFQKVEEDFLNKPHNTFVTCEMDANCEELFAHNFGQVIPPRDQSKKPSTTIIVSGDNAFTAKSLRNSAYCQEVGCYILNSRDTPPSTNSETLILTGHHDKGSDIIWRDRHDVVVVSRESHIPIDNLYFNEIPGASPFDTLPQGDTSVKHIVFSACNTANENKFEKKEEVNQNNEIIRTVSNNHRPLSELRKTYPNLESVQGWDGKAPLYEKIEEPATTLEKVATQDPAYNTGQKGYTLGQRSWYFKIGDSWMWTNDGNTCKDINTGRTQMCSPVTVNTINSDLIGG